jgi:RNA polymerase sigma factor (TIGR02999 family)
VERHPLTHHGDVPSQTGPPEFSRSYFLSDTLCGEGLRGHVKDVTQLLAEWGLGDRRALDELTALVYHELRKLARSSLRSERPEHTLQTTALVNECYIRLLGQRQISAASRAHFFGTAAKTMRRILIDHARGRNRSKRGGASVQVDLDGLSAPVGETDLVALDAALEELSAMDRRQAQIVELRFFGGLSIQETAEVMQVSAMTVKREFAVARAWLFQQIGGREQAGGISCP